MLLPQAERLWSGKMARRFSRQSHLNVVVFGLGQADKMEISRGFIIRALSSI